MGIGSIAPPPVPLAMFIYDYAHPRAMPLSTLPGRGHLRSAVSGQYDVPPVSSLAGSRAFSVAGPRASNQLPVSLRHTDCVATLKRRLQTLAYYLRRRTV